MTICTILGLALAVAGAVLMLVDDWKERPFLKNRGMWLSLAGLTCLVVPRAGWVAAIICDLIFFLLFLLYQSYWWMLGKAVDAGTWVYENSIGRFVNWPMKPKATGGDADDHSN